MNQYTKPTLSLYKLNTNTGATSTCATSTTQAKDVVGFLEFMGVSQENAFTGEDHCLTEIEYENYCKFTGAVQVFFS